MVVNIYMMFLHFIELFIDRGLRSLKLQLTLAIAVFYIRHEITRDCLKSKLSFLKFVGNYWIVIHIIEKSGFIFH